MKLSSEIAKVPSQEQQGPNAQSAEPTLSVSQTRRLVMALLTDPGAVQTQAVTSLSPGDWERIGRMARQHRLWPLLCRGLRRIGADTPDRACDAITRKAAERSLALGRECMALHRVLDDHGIAHLFLKGVPLAFGLYDAIELRPMRDIDILVRPEDLPRARGVLATHGTPALPAGPIDDALDAAAKHAAPMASPNGVVSVELHVRVLPADDRMPPAARAAFEEALWQQSDTVDLFGVGLPCPAPELTMAHIIIHGFFDHELNNGPLLITDVMALIDAAQLNADKLKTTLQALNAAAACGILRDLLPPRYRHVFDWAPAPTRDWTSDQATQLLLQDMRTRHEHRLRADLKNLGTTGRVRLLIGRLFTSRRKMLDRWKIARLSTENAPRWTFLLWVWFVARRARDMYLAGRDPVPDNTSTVDTLVSLRAALASRS